MNKELLRIMENRRSYYAIDKSSPITGDEITRIVEHAVLYTPSAFNSQSSRTVILFGEHHDRLWEITREALRKIVPAEAFSSTDKKINSFKNGYGTVLFFEDQEVVKDLQQQFELYKDNFPIWSLQSNGMLEYVVWISLTEAGLGASLQHYNPLIDDEVRSEWMLPKEWKLLAQMPFGKPLAQPDEKEFNPLHDRLKVFG